MSEYPFSKTYIIQKGILDEYLKKAQFWINLYNLSRWMLLSILVIPFGMAFFNIPIISIQIPIQSLKGVLLVSYIATLLASLSLFFFPFFWFIGKNRINAFKKKFEYDKINEEFVYAYEALTNHDLFRYSNNILYKEKASKSLKKAYDHMEKWTYDIPLINYENRKKIQSLYELKYRFIGLIESNEEKNKQKAHNALMLLSLFVLYGSEISLHSIISEFDDVEFTYRDRYTKILYNLKNNVRGYVIKHKLRSQLITTFLWIGIIILFGNYFNLSVEIIFGTIVSGGFIGSIAIFNWITKEILDIKES